MNQAHIDARQDVDALVHGLRALKRAGWLAPKDPYARQIALAREAATRYVRLPPEYQSPEPALKRALTAARKAVDKSRVDHDPEQLALV